MKHIFLTGEIQVGKSTIINKICSELNNNVPHDFSDNVRGFHTIAVNDSKTDVDSLYILPYEVNEPREIDKPFAIRNKKERKKEGFHEVFDNLGVTILRSATTNETTKLIIMDELGFFENDALLFQNEVLETLNGNTPVLGVIKPKQTDFLNAVRNLSNVSVIEITEENRNELYPKVSMQIKELLFK